MGTLDLPAYVGQRAATFRFKLINAVTKQIFDDLHPLVEPQPATITHDTSRTIKRQLSMTLGVQDTTRINIVQSRVLPFMVIGGVEYPLGRFMFADDTYLEYSRGSISSVVLLDEMNVVDQQLENAIAPGYFGFTGITELIQRIITPFDISYRIDPVNYSTNGTWPIGTNRGNVLEDLSLEGGYFSPWFDNNGVLQFRIAVDPATVMKPDFDWDANRVVYRGSMSRTNDLLNAPNRFIVISNSTSGASQASVPVVGRYDVPDSAPWSIANRGFVVPKVVEQGVDTVVQAQAIATTLGQRQLVFERYNLDTAPNPRHDSYNVIRWKGQNWLELAWTLTCQEGEPMGHVLRKAFV